MKTLAIVILLFSSASLSSSQTLDPSASTTDFSGIWKLNRKSSTDDKTLSRFDEVSLVISQNGSAITVVRSGTSRKKTRVYELTYFTDGRGEENPNPLGSMKRRSKTFWSYGNLISEYILTSWISSTSEYYKQEARDIWELSRDRGTLTIRTEVSEAHNVPDIVRGFIRPEKYKKVFSRVR